jgi:YHS domain-containing protein
MKAAARQPRISFAAGLVALALGVPAARANTARAPAPASLSTLPAGLPELPSLGEVMQRDLNTGLAINGIDPVSYRLGEKPMAGRAAYELIRDGFVWRFASQANLEAFRDAPEIYTPAFGGFDPTGVANGAAVDSDPGQFAIVGARLFLFRSAENRERFLQNAALLAQAESRWSSVLRLVAQ